MKKKLAIVTTHPIQYHAPLFKQLSERNSIAVRVFYTWSQANEEVYDPGFGKQRKWDIPLLEGYEYTFVNNVSKKPGSHHFFGIENPELITTIENWQADAVLVFGWAFKSHLRCLRYFKGKVPVLFRGDSTLINETTGLKTILRRIFLKWVYRHIDIALYVGQQNKAYFLKHGVSETNLFRAPHAVDNDRFSSVNDDEQETCGLKKQLGIEKSDFVILFAGKFEPVKNPFFILELAKRISDPHVKFVLVGNGILEADLKAKAARDKRIKFLDFQNQSRMPYVYRLATVFILPSRSETWGLAANEAMACGLPVLLSEKVGGAVDLVEENGMIFTAEEYEKVAHYIKELTENPKKLVSAGANSVALIHRFHFNKITAVVEKVINGSSSVALIGRQEALDL